MITFKELKIFLKENVEGSAPYYVNMRNGYRMHIYSGAEEANIYSYEEDIENPVLKFIILESREKVKVIKCEEGRVEYSDSKLYSFHESLLQLDSFISNNAIVEAIISL